MDARKTSIDVQLSKISFKAFKLAEELEAKCIEDFINKVTEAYLSLKQKEKE